MEGEGGAVARLHGAMLRHGWDVFFITQRPRTEGEAVQRQTQRWLDAQGFDLPSVLVLGGSRTGDRGSVQPRYTHAMRLRRRALSCAWVALAGLGLVVLTGCRDSSGPSPPPGATTVRGTERLAWSQSGDVTTLRFRAYVDGQPVALDAATCDGSSPEATCTSPLPALTTGVHSIALTAVSANGVESPPSVTITVLKVSGASVLGMGRPHGDRSSGLGSRRSETVATSDGLAFSVDIVRRNVQAPAQLACDADGRLFVAEGDGQVRVVRPGEPDGGEPALGARDVLRPAPLGPPGLALHPDFPRNHFVYVGFVAEDPPGQTLLRLVRLREVGDTLGEPVPLYETPLTVSAIDGSGWPRPGEPAGLSLDGPRLAFGPDRLLYIALPPGVEFDEEPTASTPHPAMLRLGDDGRVPVGVAPLSGVVTHPLAFDWHPSSGALWVALRGEAGEAVLRRIGARRETGPADTGLVTLRVAADERVSGALLFDRAHGHQLEPARVFLAVPQNEALSVVRFANPMLTENLLAGMFGRIGDVVLGPRGSLFLVTRNGEPGDVAGGPGEDLIVKLTPMRR